AVFVLLGDRTDGPIRVQYLMLTAILECRANAKASFGFDGAGEPILVSLQFADWNIENSHLHSASDIDTDSIGNNRVLSCKNSTDGQTISDMGVRHESASDRDGEEAGPFHLHDGFVFEAFAPLAVFDRFGTWRRRRSEKGLGEFLAQGVFDKCGGVGEDRF